MLVIIGGGPTGLYLAIRLWQLEFRNFVVIDPRAGIYTRPGRLVPRPFKLAEQKIPGIKVPERPVQIKDYERQLYHKAQEFGLPIIKSSFLSLHVDSLEAGILVEHESGDLERIRCDFVIDCSGSRRVVVNELNKLPLDVPLKIKKNPPRPLPHHLIVRVKMDRVASIDGLRDANRNQKTQLSGLAPRDYFRKLLALRHYGWYEYILPRVYGESHGKNKACFYIPTPADLDIARAESWLALGLSCHTALPFVLEPRPPSKKLPPKPRCHQFIVRSNYLDTFVHQSENLSTVVPLGDALMDSDFLLGQGISNGIVQVEIFLKHLDIVAGHIVAFHVPQYQAAMRQQIEQQKAKLLALSAQQTEDQSATLVVAAEHLKGLRSEVSESEQAEIDTFLSEIQVLQDYERVKALMMRCYSEDMHLILRGRSLKELILKQQRNTLCLVMVLNALPRHFNQRRLELVRLLFFQAQAWSVLGGTLYKSAAYREALRAYQLAIVIYQSPLFCSKCPLKELELYINLSTVYTQLGWSKGVILATQKAHALYSSGIAGSAFSRHHFFARTAAGGVVEEEKVVLPAHAPSC
jgi:hypothetical protein